jgi:hypothetical protein
LQIELIAFFGGSCLGGPISRTILGVVSTLLLIWIAAWKVLGTGTYNFDPLGEKGAFEPHLKRYQDLAKLIITFSTASVAFVFGFLVNHPTEARPQNAYAAALAGASSLAICSLCASIFLLLFFMLGQTYLYESYCHRPADRRDIYKGWLYALQISVGWTGFLSFLFAYGYLAFRLINRA